MTKKNTSCKKCHGNITNRFRSNRLCKKQNVCLCIKQNVRIICNTYFTYTYCAIVDIDRCAIKLKLDENNQRGKRSLLRTLNGAEGYFEFYIRTL